MQEGPGAILRGPSQFHLQWDGAGWNHPTYGGYSTKVVVDQRYVLRIPKQLRPEEAAPLLCAGITTYSLAPLGVGKKHRLAVVGLGDLAIWPSKSERP